MAIQSQTPYSTPEALNVWPRDTFQGRMRGGSRPGLAKVFPDAISAPCHLLANVRVVEDSKLTTWEDSFPHSGGSTRTLANFWSPAPWRSGGVNEMPNIGPEGDFAYIYDTEGPRLVPNIGDTVLEDLNITTTGNYTISLRYMMNRTVRADGTWLRNVSARGDYSIFFQMDDNNPNVRSDGMEVRLTFGLSNHRVEVYKNGVEAELALIERTLDLSRGEVLSVEVDTDAGTGVVKLAGAIVPGLSSITLNSSPAGQRIGFGLGPKFGQLFPERDDGEGQQVRVDYFRITYEGSPVAQNRNIVVVAGGTNASAAHSGEVDLWYEDTPGVLSVPDEQGVGADTGINNAKARHLQAAEYLGRLYIVGEDAEGVWQFDPRGDGSLVTLATSVDDEFPFVSATTAVPSNCTAIAQWNNRLCVVTRDDPQNISMSRYEIPGNWSYQTIPVGSAVQLSTTGVDSGKVSEPISALIAHTDDYLLIGCLNSFWVLRGDPTLNGVIDRLSSSIGMVAPQAWARGPNGETVFLSSDGLYAVQPGADPYPQSISREKLPNELRDIDVNHYRVLMAYDVRNRGVFIGLTPMFGPGGTYFWFDWEFRGFWPMSFDPSREPTALVYRNADNPLDQRMIFGCRDGFIRAFDDQASRDDGAIFESEILYGPIALGGTGYSDGLLLEIIGQTGAGSGDVLCEVMIGDSIESARNATPRSPFTFKAGKNLTHRPRLRGNACFLRISGVDGNAWAMENLTIRRERLGKQRL